MFCIQWLLQVIQVITDHSAVKTVLGAPTKHARWRLKAFGSGVMDVQIVYRPGADALSQNPFCGSESWKSKVCGCSSSPQEESWRSVCRTLLWWKLYGTIRRNWWWPTVCRVVMELCKNCPCVVVSGTGRKQVPPLHLISVQRPSRFSAWTLCNSQSQRNEITVIVFQDVLTSGHWFFLHQTKRPSESLDLLLRK